MTFFGKLMDNLVSRRRKPIEKTNRSNLGAGLILHGSGCFTAAFFFYPPSIDFTVYAPSMSRCVKLFLGAKIV